MRHFSVNSLNELVAWDDETGEIYKEKNLSNKPNVKELKKALKSIQTILRNGLSPDEHLFLNSVVYPVNQPAAKFTEVPEIKGTRPNLTYSNPNYQTIVLPSGKKIHLPSNAEFLHVSSKQRLSWVDHFEKALWQASVLGDKPFIKAKFFSEKLGKTKYVQLI
jgi:hypothetical protein